MSEKRYFKIEYGELWYLFDSTTISEQLVKEQAEYGYGVFANSLSPLEVVDLLNEQQSDLNYLARFIGEFKVEEFKLKLRNLRILEEENKQMKKQLEQIPKSIREVWLE